MRTQGAMLRAKAEWTEAGEKPEKYFVNLEKTKFNKRTLQQVENTEGKIVSGNKEILGELEKYYTKLYTSRKVNLVDNFFLDSIETPLLSNEQSIVMNREITLAELGTALFNLKNGKTPGCDGLPIDWYKVFGEKLST